MPKKVALVSFYDLNSFGVRTLHASLKRENIPVDSLFFKCQNPTTSQDKPTEKEINSLVKFIELNDYDFVGLSFRSFLFPIVKKISVKLRKLKNKPILIFGGIQATINPKKCIKYADIVVIGEGEKVLIDICKGKRLNRIENIYYKKGKRVIKSKIDCIVEQDIDKLPFPDYTDENKYFLNNGKTRPLKTKEYKTVYNLMTSRGCPFNCSFCSNSYLRKVYKGKYVRRRSVNNVIEELKIAKEMFPNLLNITFWDDVFTFDKRWIKEFAKKYKKEINLPFMCFIHPINCEEETIKLLNSVGLKMVSMGVQTFSNRIRKVYRRPETTKQIFECCRIFHKYNIGFSLDLIIDDPLQTKEDLEENFNSLLKISPPLIIHTFTLAFFPNMEISESYLKWGLITEKRLEDDLGKNWNGALRILDLERNKLNLFYDCLYFLCRFKYRNEYLLRKIHKSEYWKKNPQKLAKLLKFFSFDYFTFEWDSKKDRFKFFISQGILSLFKQPIKFTFLKMKQRVLDPEVMNL